MPNRIVLLAPERLHTIIEQETREGRRAELAEALLRLFHLHAAYTGRPHDEDPHQRDEHERVATIIPCVERAGEKILLEFAWGILEDPHSNGYGGTTGKHVINGGLIQHSDLTWSNHT